MKIPTRIRAVLRISWVAFISAFLVMGLAITDLDSRPNIAIELETASVRPACFVHAMNGSVSRLRNAMDHRGLSSEWFRAISAYRAQKMEEAAEQFQSIALQTKLSSEDKAAANFWSYRALSELGEEPKAREYLYKAAAEPQSFYSMLACQKVDQDISLLNNKEAESEQAENYPFPRWKPTTGYRIEPALLFAIMRQESGFNPHARSNVGALGMMQLMPETAQMMAKSSRALQHIHEPSVNISLGQKYIEHLMDQAAIGNNLIFLAASYNAGPGALASWAKRLEYGNDPLLFVESIPYGETRNFVLRVMSNYWVYSELLGMTTVPSITALLKNDWPRYATTEAKLAAMQDSLKN